MTLPTAIPTRSGPLVAALCALALAVLALPACDWSGRPPGGGAAGTPSPVLLPEPTLDAEGHSCLAADLKVVAGWQGAGGAMAGGLSFINRGPTDCVLRGRPGVHLVNAKGNLMPVANVEYTEAQAGDSATATPVSGITLHPGGRSFVFFEWRNWCGDAQGPFKLAVALPDDGGQLTVPAQDPTGAPISTSPRCDDPNTASTVAVGSFQENK